LERPSATGIAAEFLRQWSETCARSTGRVFAGQMEKAEADELGGLVIESSGSSVLKDLGLATAMGVMITDKETQQPAAMVICGHAEPYRWEAERSLFLQAMAIRC